MIIRLGICVLGILFGIENLFATGFSMQMSEKIPNAINYTTLQYNAANKNWGIAIAPSGNIYIANNKGLLEYNGLKWRLYTESASPITRSVATDDSGCIYTGGFREFGYWKPDSTGKLHYKSLSGSLSSFDFKDEDIWRIQVVKDGVYFQSFSKIYFYSFADQSLRVIDPKRFILFAQNVRDQVYIESNGDLMQLQARQLLRKGSIDAATVRVILPFETDQFLFGAASGELFVGSLDQPQPWHSEIAEAIKGYDLNCAIRLKNGNYLFGTLVNGLYESDSEGRLLRHYSTDNLLQSNTVHALVEDNRGNVWLALDEGITKLEYDSKINSFIDPTRKLGAVYSASFFRGNLYLATNKGLFYLPQSALSQLNPFSGLKPVLGSSAQVWSIRQFGNELICGDNKGAFRIEDGQARYLYAGSGVLDMTSLDKDKKILLSTYYKPVLLTLQNDGKYAYEDDLNGSAGICNSIELDNQQFVWMGHLYDGLFQSGLDKDSSKLNLVRHFASEDFGLKNTPVRVTKFGHRVVFIHNNRFFFYNDISKNIEPFALLNDLQLPLDQIRDIVPLNNQFYWIVGKNGFILLKYYQGSASIVDIIHLDPSRISTVDDSENIVSLNDSVSLVCLNNGFALLNDIISDRAEFFIDRVSVFGAKSGVLSLPLQSEMPVSLPVSMNTFRFEIGSRFTSEGDTYYRYMLEGIDSTWSKPVKVSDITYDRLPQGNYVFRVQALSTQESNLQKNESTFAFQIQSPWYQRAWAWLMGCLLVLLIFWQIYRQIKQKHIQELIRQDCQNEEKRVREKNEMLERLVKTKNNELFQVTALMLRKNEMLANVRNEIEAFSGKHPDLSVTRKLNRIARSMNEDVTSQEDWSLFIMHFEQTHPNFFKRVKIAYPSFTSAELKLSACLKLNLATKDIASLLNISVRGVEAGRYRLRKKLEIGPNENLNEFFIRNF